MTSEVDTWIVSVPSKSTVFGTWTVLGIVVNRFNVSLVAFNWQLPADERYFPSIPEIGVSVFIVTVGIVAAFVLGASFQVLPIPALAVLAGLAMVLFRCLTSQQAYDTLYIGDASQAARLQAKSREE